ncbi:lytic murein transglycosylase [Arsenicitalea aurantiaca]|uniref:lytic murein transglycosylase n=1 Tax=Arsenicitalea aurantiaca TaxID=1783274 RepID=UPI001FCEADA7|nr:lytic murein transglycosylase [Arsenicitalea aurantiaca]
MKTEAQARRRSAPRLILALSTAAILAVSSVTTPLASNQSPAAFIAGLWPEAQARGVSRSVFDASLAGFQPSERVMGLTRSQPEFAETVASYIGKRVTAAQIQRGQSMSREWAQTLAGVAQRYQGTPEIILAIWGMETNFGGYMGGNNTIHALATLTHGGYRTDFFRNELLTALQIVNEGHIAPRDMVGSWAGAMGHTQFMPSSFKRFAVDYNGDGRADIWNSVPDALASTANYLKAHGWRQGETWGYEVRLPQNFDYSRAWSMGTASIADWQRMGVARVTGRDFPRPSDQARLYLPAGGDGPAFLLLPNFDVIKRYNNSDSYALAVGHLADRILGYGNFVTAWPSDAQALTRTQRQEVQTLLSRRGFDAGPSDGVIGPRTRQAIIAFQRQRGLLPDGFPSGRLLAALR